MDTALRDIRFALRLLLRSPLFAAVSILALRSVVLKPLPFEEPEALAWVWSTGRLAA